MWKLYVAIGNEEKTNYYRDELKKQLDVMSLDDFQYESLLNHIDGLGEQPVHMV